MIFFFRLWQAACHQSIGSASTLQRLRPERPSIARNELPLGRIAVSLTAGPMSMKCKLNMMIYHDLDIGTPLVDPYAMRQTHWSRLAPQSLYLHNHL